MPVVMPIAAPIRDFTLGRLALPTLGSPITESLGSQLTQVGDSTAVGQRRAKGFALMIPVHGTPGDTDLQATGNRMRRQLRSMMQNHPYRLQGVYAKINFDPERNGWLVIGASELADANGGVPFAEYQLSLSDAFLVAQTPTHREAFRAALVDRRSTQATVDYLEQIVNTAASFAGQNALSRIFLPVGATDVAVNDSGVAVLGARAGKDGTCAICTGLSNGDVVTWDRTEANFNLGDVIVYDRRGNLGPFGASGAYDQSPVPTDVQGAYGWNEVYGSTWPWSNPTTDVPVIQNSHCRVRYDPANQLGFKVEAWDGGGWVEQGKITLFRNDSSTGGPGYTPLDTLVSSSLVEYTPDRTVILAVLRSSTDAYSRERVYVTLQRGWTGPRVEVYASAGRDGTTTSTGAVIRWSAVAADSNDSVVTIGTAGAITATAGSGSAAFPSGFLGAYPMAGENWVAMLRQPASGAALVATLATVLADTYLYTTSDSAAYGAARNSVQLMRPAGGYVTGWLGLNAPTADQILEAETVRNTGSGTTSQVSDAGASGGLAVKDTQTTEAANTLLKAASSLLSAKYRVFVRVKVDSGATGSFRAFMTSGGTGTIVTTTSTSWVWLDLGGLTPAGASPNVAVNGWRSAGGSGAVYIDRVEILLTEDRVRAGATFGGSRDHGQAALYDAQPQVRRIPRG